ncbi:hypothetical protein MARI_33910 (plasmid) [Marinobacter sp. JH2]|nr:helix-turn-helix domain-containing protein [Marinobacter sp. JH2]QBM19245.1 hypothetical protein MARI_33910 [Marinobacter sp. JH2]
MKSHISYAIVEVLTENVGADYAADKTNQLKPLETAQVLLWCNNLDAVNQAAVAERLGVSKSQFSTTIETIRQLIG